MIDASRATWLEVETAWKSGKTAIIAVGAQEEHGPHCPLSTDTKMSHGLAVRLASALDAVLLPDIPYGETWSSSGYPGTISLTPDTLRRILLDIGVSLKNQGVRALVIVNGHFGNRAPMELAIRELKDKHSFSSLVVDYPGLDELAQQTCESQPAAPTFYHADEVETSILLALDPSLVRMDRAVAEYPDFPPTFGSEPILLDTFCESGVFGDPRPSTAEKGEILLHGLVERSLTLIRAFLKKV